MNQLSRRTMLLTTSAATLTLGSLSFAQGQSSDSQAGTLDAMMAMKLLIAGRKQITVCEQALAKLKDDGAKEFAKAEIQEHQDMKAKLKQLGFEYQASGNANSSTTKAASGFTANGKSLPEHEFTTLQMVDEVASQCIETQKAEMGKLQGKEFDKRFIESQLDAHYDLFDHGVTFRKHASSTLAPPLDEARTVIEKHIAKCKELCKSLT
jgi:predicted outer membrane protein